MSKGIAYSSDEGKGRSIAILGNGPSLRDTIDNDSTWLLSHDLMAVNFAANTPDFYYLRPKYYILADKHFFSGVDNDENVKRLWNEFSKVSWEMTLFIPSKFHHLAKALLLNAPEIKLRNFNLTPVEGSKTISHFLFDLGLGMPRPRNVMIPALMCAIRMGYKEIYLCGADHTWTKTLDVTPENIVVSVQPHFYNDNDKEHRRVKETYRNIRLHEVLGSMATAFKSYCEISNYAKKKGVNIINATPGSMIDAFSRKYS